MEEQDAEPTSSAVPASRTEIANSSGIQVGSGNVQYNYYYQQTGSWPTGPVVAGEIPQEPVAFQPRADLLSELRSAGPGVAVVTTVTGMRGVGKTQLAAAYARECAAAGWRLVAWVNAGDTAILAGLAVVATRLGLVPENAAAGEAADAVRDWLAADGTQCLLVFDNAGDMSEVGRFVPAKGQARIVVTTTDAATEMSSALVPVDVYREDEGLNYLTQRTGRSDVAGAREVGNELGWLPLGLAQAGAVIAAQRLTYGTYLDRLRSVPADEYLTAQRGAAYPRGTAEAILMSLDAVFGDDGDATGMLCREVLDLVALLSPAGVPKSLLHAVAESGMLRQRTWWRALTKRKDAVSARQVDEALGRLASNSLLTYSGEGEDATVTAHRLVTRVVRERAARATALIPLGLRACRALKSVMDSLGESEQHRAAARDLTAQVFALHEHLQPHLAENLGLEVELLIRRAWAFSWLLELGYARDDQAVELGQSLLADHERLLGPNDPDTLNCRDNLASAYLEAGRADEAVAIHEAAVASIARHRGHDYRSTVQRAINLSAAYLKTGRLDEAMTLLETIQAWRNVLLDEYDPYILTLQNNLASAYLVARRSDKAIPLFEATLATTERLQGRDHSDTLVSQHNLAFAYEMAGRLDRAIPLFEAAVAGSERVLGHDHPSTVLFRKNLADALEKLRQDHADPPGETMLFAAQGYGRPTWLRANQPTRQHA